MNGAVHVRSGQADTTVRLLIAELRGSDSARTGGLDEGHVDRLVEAGAGAGYGAEDEAGAGADGALPPILVHHCTMRVVDGVHRIEAARLAGRSAIEASFVYGDLENVFRVGVRANVSNGCHGLPLSLADRRAAAARIIRSDPRSSDRSIARDTGLAAKTVATIRERSAGVAEASHRVGRDGRVRPLDVAEGRMRAGRIITQWPDASLRDIAREAGISVGTARDVRMRVAAGELPVPGVDRHTVLDKSSLDKASQAGRTRTGNRGGLTDAPAMAQAGRTRTAGLGGRSREPEDLDSVLERLRRDPALRYSDAGRAVLRWLDARTVSMDQWRAVAGDLPAHSTPSVAKLARECARVWTMLAEEME